MTTTTAISPHLTATLDQLLRLSLEERLEIAERLFESVPTLVTEENLLTWQRRAAELQDGRVVGIPMGEALTNARKALNKVSRS